ncbi:FHA domain-containing protein [Acetivibrio saccincola]|uniref:ABC transporter ATP-binding/permease protein n=1 Tax=Acetivibrio saccincola TaxID=1677857 RepID=A0A2K9E4S3_9FIRM|nr:FHA domain-containing protein [Acetivibrio saccincola]AUG56466.1 ABC transporter ATP-binding/permease protein [Acetivibrio saccincola]NLW27684.1 FHA domain-containing protein [Acetivibrio saccincola]PQQ66551.1 FHA domain-containing protein [Acetivibrio saccincola]HQD28487.1 FHA domain-containing protein [Acetivibrio saccincola]
MVEVVLLIAKVVFASVIYLFIFSIIRLIYLDIKSMNVSKVNLDKGFPTLRLKTRRELLPFKVEDIYVLSKSMTIGRQDKNDIVIKDSFISGIHAQFILERGEVYIRDLDSKNGVFINEKRVENNSKNLLKDNDIIKIGQIEFIFVKG